MLDVLQIHWFSIINSCVTVVLLTGFLATILMRVLKNDFIKYTRDDEGATLLCLNPAAAIAFFCPLPTHCLQYSQSLPCCQHSVCKLDLQAAMKLCHALSVLFCPCSLIFVASVRLCSTAGHDRLMYP